MTFAQIGFGFFVFATFWILHLLWWRLCRPKGEIRPLVLVFLVAPGLLFLGINRFYPFWGTLDLALAFFVHLALAVVYIQTYPAIASTIPSFRILIGVHASKGGLSVPEIEGLFAQGELIGSRVELLGEDGLVRSGEKGLELSSFGRLLAVVFLTYRRFLGLQRGQG